MQNIELDHLRHSTAHLLAAAVLQMWPDTKLTIGPAIENGFYYDFDVKEPISEKDFPKIEGKMRDLVKQWKEFEKIDSNHEDAVKRVGDNEFKHELIEEISKKGEPITFYKSGEFVDLCRGGHVDAPSKELKHFKLLSVAGAYWRGDEKNKMLTRIYGTAFATKEELDEHLKHIEEAKKRDHRKLGKELDLFTFSDLVGAGLPLFTPKGTIIRMQLQQKLYDISKKYRMLPVMIPHIAKLDLYEKSGHAAKFGDELFKVKSHYDLEFVMKPVNCPHHTQIYASRPRSYRDLPIRYMESTMQYRDEKPGEIGGLTRVRAITVDDGHIFCTVDQIKQEAINIAKIIEEFYTSLGMYGNHWVSLSVRDPEHPEKYIGEEKDWELAEKMLQDVSDEQGLNAKRMEGEAALYGPKLDFMFKDALGNERQLSTIQLDFATAKRFDLTYAENDGTDKNPVIIHRAILGSYERFIAILIEHYAGAFPLWLAPVQVAILPVSEKHIERAKQVEEELLKHDIRVELDNDAKTLGAKIRTATLQKVPYMVIIGDKETSRDDLVVTVRTRDGSDEGLQAVSDFMKTLKTSIAT